MPKISIIVPVYNVEQYLHQCLESILNQSFEDFELICINDGSTDNSLKILKQFSSKDKRVKIINQKNKGSGETRNIGIKKSKGDYVYFVDADDYLDKEALSKLYNNAFKNKSDIVITKITRFDDDKIDYNNPGFDLDKIFNGVNFNNFTFNYTKIKYHVMNSSFAPWTKFYSKKFLDSYDELYFEKNKAYEDVLFHIKVILRAKKISFMPDFVYFYRNNPSSVTSTKSNALDIINVCDEVEHYLKENGFYEFFEGEFVLFKVKQLMNYLTFSESEKYYKKTRKYFIKVNNKYLTNTFYNKNYIPKYLLDNIEWVINSKTLESYKLRIQINELINQKNYLFNENKDLKHTVEEKNNESNSLIEEKNKLIAENTQLKNQNLKIMADNKKVNTENKKIIEENRYIIEENNDIKTENIVLLNKNNKFESEFTDINGKYEILLKEHDESVLKNNEYQQRLNELNEKLKDYNVLIERNEKYEKNIQELNITLKNNEKELANNYSALENMNLKISGLKESNKEFQQNNVNLLLKSNKQLKTIDSLEEVIEEKNKEYVLKCLELSNSIEHAEKISLELSNSKSINQSQNKENIYLKNKISTLNHSLTIKSNEIRKNQEKSEKTIADLNLKNKNLTFEISKLNTKIIGLNNEITALKKEIDDLTVFKHNLLNSNSWKLMKPFRSLKNMNKN